MIATAKSRIARSLSLRARIASACITVALVAHGTPSAAATAEERAACRSDVFRLCAGEIPNRGRIIACMKRNHSRLSPNCAVVFDRAMERGATR